MAIKCKICKYCKKKKIETVSLPCGHVGTCLNCAVKKIDCYMCGKPITHFNWAEEDEEED
jgi:hypothetical protein